MKNNKNAITIYKTFAVAFSFVAIVMIVIYFVSFHGGLSSDISDWDSFGSYFSVVVAVLNLVFFIIITIYVAKMQDDSISKQLRQDKELNLQTFKWNRLEELMKILNKVSLLTVGEINFESIKYVYNESCKFSYSISVFVNCNKLLFKNINFEQALRSTNKFKDYVEEIKDQNSFQTENATKLNQLMKEMVDSLNGLVVNIQNELLTNN